MCPEFETFFAEYRKWCHDTADYLADILEGELTGIYQTIGDDPAEVERWDEFEKLVRRPIPLKLKWERYNAVKRTACGQPAGIMQ
jgi:hypothetical protein